MPKKRGKNGKKLRRNNNGKAKIIMNPFSWKETKDNETDIDEIKAWNYEAFNGKNKFHFSKNQILSISEESRKKYKIGKSMRFRKR